MVIQKLAKYLDIALNRQNLNTVPNEIKESWVDGVYKYEVRMHKAEEKYSNYKTILRVERHKKYYGHEYLGSDGNWYSTSVLKEFYKDGTPNHSYNENAARITHIPVR